MSDPCLLEAEGLCTYYGTSQALFDVCLKAPSRGAVAILGRNGAGKTTLLKTLAGDLRPARGSVRFDGREATHMRAELRARRGMGYVPQEYGVFARLTVEDNLLVGSMSAQGRTAAHRRDGHPVPLPGPALRPAGGDTLGRRAQNAGDQPRLARAAAPADAGRTDRGRLAWRRRRDRRAAGTAGARHRDRDRRAARASSRCGCRSTAT